MHNGMKERFVVGEISHSPLFFGRNLADLDFDLMFKTGARTMKGLGSSKMWLT
jgi:hypothetical protein